MTAGHRGLEQSVMTRIANRSRQLGLEPNVLLSRFVTERFLFRLARSPHASRFVLKGATLMPLWLGETARPTRDADLAGFGDMSPTVLAAIVHEVLELSVEPDGVVYDRSSVRISAIREAIRTAASESISLRGLGGRACRCRSTSASVTRSHLHPSKWSCLQFSIFLRRACVRIGRRHRSRKSSMRS